LTNTHLLDKLTLGQEKVMARSDTRYSVYPAAKAVEVLGASAPDLNQAIECWAAVLVRALADNSKNIFPVDPSGSGPLLAPDELHFLHEWCVLAEALHGKRLDPDYAKPGDLLAAAVEDAHRFESVGEKWFQSAADGEMYAKGLSSCVGELVEKLHYLDYAHAWAVIVAVQWLWEHHEEKIGINKDPWWTLEFRRHWHRKLSENNHGTATTDQQKEGKRRSRKTPPKQ
jgi:hypothetical protein